MSAARSLSRDLVAGIRAEFPGFEIRKKRAHRLQRIIHYVLLAITFGGQRVYLTRYHTAMFGRLYVPDAWDGMTDEDRYILLRHERVHLRQRRRMTGFGMAVVYLVPILPMFLAYGRARLEWEAYEETIRATAEVRGMAAARALEAELVRRYTGGDYGWMWPFPSVIRRWFQQAIQAIEEESRADTFRR